MLTQSPAQTNNNSLLFMSTPTDTPTPVKRKIKRLEGISYMPLLEINVSRDTRARRSHKEVLANAQVIAASIILVGPISPLVIDENKNLIAGECRWEAYKLLGETEVPYVIRSKLDATQQRMLELDENNCRRRMAWQDIALGINEIHHSQSKISDKKKEQWTTRATGQLVGQSHSHVADCIKVAEFLLRGDIEIQEAKSLEQAKQIILGRRELAIIQAQTRIAASATTSPTAKVPKPKPSGIINIQLGLPSEIPPDTFVKAASPEEIQKMQQVSLSDKLFNMDCVDLMMNHLPEKCIDAVLTDIPYGIDMDLLEDIHGVDAMRSTHDVQQNVEQMKPFLQGAYRVLKDNTFLMFFYAQQHQEKLATWGREVGFSVLDWNLIWLKPHSCKNNAPHQNFTKSYEPVMVMKKGSPHLARPMVKCHMEVDGMPDKRIQSNPFAKPQEFIKTMMIEPIHFPGMTILDPFAGEGSILRTAALMNCKPIGCEIDTDRFPRLVQQMKTVYKNLLGNNVVFS